MGRELLIYLPPPIASKPYPAPSPKRSADLTYPTVTTRRGLTRSPCWSVWDRAAFLRVAVEAQAKLSAFVRYVLAEGPWAGHGIDGGDTQDAAERFGLISPAPYDPAKHGYHVDFSDGDRWFKFTPLVLPLSSIGATTPGGEAMSTDNVLTERLLAAARIEALSLALAEAEKQRDEADEECRLSMTTIAEGRDRADALEAKLRVAVEALRPFANYPVGSIGMGEDGYVMTLAVGGQEPTFADFERARAALSSIGEV
jgi:hypothetical protein